MLPTWFFLIALALFGLVFGSFAQRGHLALSARRVPVQPSLAVPGV